MGLRLPCLATGLTYQLATCPIDVGLTSLFAVPAKRGLRWSTWGLWDKRLSREELSHDCRKYSPIVNNKCQKYPGTSLTMD